MLDCLLEGTTMRLSSLERARHWKAVKLRSHWMEAKTWSHQDAQLHYGMRMGLSRWRRSQCPPVLGRRALREAMPRIPLGKLHASSVQHPMYPSSGELCARGRKTDAALQSPRISRSRRLAEDRTELQSLSASSCQRGRGCRAALTWHGGQPGVDVFRMSFERDNIVMSRPAKANFGTTESTLPIKTLAWRQGCSWSVGAWCTKESSWRRVRRDEQPTQLKSSQIVQTLPPSPANMMESCWVLFYHTEAACAQGEDAGDTARTVSEMCADTSASVRSLRRNRVRRKKKHA